MTELTHFDEHGSSRMVDVGGKAVTFRLARAESFVQLKSETLAMILDRKVAKGDVFEVARLAGIMATKRTADLIPLCHPLGIDGVEVRFTHSRMPEWRPEGSAAVADAEVVRIEATVRVHGRTGVEMEALTAVTVAGLTIYDMCKSVDRSLVLGPTRLLEKLGGKSGHFQAEA
jgi:cyclic pyranopterin phosphate synthase